MMSEAVHHVDDVSYKILRCIMLEQSEVNLKEKATNIIGSNWKFFVLFGYEKCITKSNPQQVYSSCTHKIGRKAKTLF
jgi:hypothetical protein